MNILVGVMKKRLWIISELFPPDETSTSYIMGEIANAMAIKYEVKVICGPEIYDKGKKIDEKQRFVLDESVELIRCNAPVINKNSKLQKLYRFIIVSRNIFKEAERLIKEGDKVLMVTNPLPLILKMAKLREKRHFMLMLLVHDVFPENLIPAGIKLPYLAYKTIAGRFAKAYSKADLMIALGRDMKEVLKKKVAAYNENQNIIIIENWGDVTDISPQPKQIDSYKCTIEYAGNIGAVQGIEEFVNLFCQANNPYLELSIWGTGSVESKIKNLILSKNLKSIKLNGPYLRSEQNKVLNDCDIALVTLAKGMFGLGVPSKTYNILASGKPILYIGETESEIGLLVKEHNLGWVFTPQEEHKITNFLSNLTEGNMKEIQEKGHNARVLAENLYSKDFILNKFVQL